MFSAASEAKRLQLLNELVPKAGKLAALVNLNNPNAEAEISEIWKFQRATGRQILLLRAGTKAEIDTAFTTIEI